MKYISWIPWFLAGSSIVAFYDGHTVRGGITLAVAVICGWVEEGIRNRGLTT